MRQGRLTRALGAAVAVALLAAAQATAEPRWLAGDGHVHIPAVRQSGGAARLR
jgi:hypothetical protein